MEVNTVLFFALMLTGRAQGLPAISCAEYCISRTFGSEPIGRTLRRDACNCFYNRLEPVHRSVMSPSNWPQDILPLLPSPVDDTSIYYQPAENAHLQEEAALVDHPFFILDPTFKPTPPAKPTKKRKAETNKETSSTYKNNFIAIGTEDSVYLDIGIAESEERAAENSGPKFISENDLSECIDLHILAHKRDNMNLINSTTISIVNNMTSYETLSDADLKVEIEKKCSQIHSLVNKTIYDILDTRPKKAMQTPAHGLNTDVRISGTDQQRCSTESSTIRITDRSAKTNYLKENHVSEVPLQLAADMSILAESEPDKTIQNVTMMPIVFNISTKRTKPNMDNTSDIPFQVTSNTNHAAMPKDTKADNSLEITTTFRSYIKILPIPDIRTKSDNMDRPNQNIFENPITTARYTDIKNQREYPHLYSTISTNHPSLEYKTEYDFPTATTNNLTALESETLDGEINKITVNKSLKKQLVDDQIPSDTKHAFNVVNPVFPTDEPITNNSEIENTFYNIVFGNETQESIDTEFIRADTSLPVEDFTEDIEKHADMNLDTNAVNHNAVNIITASNENNEQKQSTKYNVIITSTEITSTEVDPEISKIITRELFNDTVISKNKGVETESRDVIENHLILKETEKQQENSIKDSNKFVDDKSSELIGNIFFKTKNAEVPVRWRQNAEGRLILGIDGDSLCDKMLTGNRKQLLFFILCDCVRNNRC